MFSSTKSLTAIAFSSLVDRGLLSYSDRVCEHWPEFASDPAKAELRVCDVLRHEAGMVVLDKVRRSYYSNINFEGNRMFANIL